MKNERRGMLQMLACAALWSTAGVLFKYIPWNAFVIAALRALMAGITVGVYLLLLRQKPVLNRRTVRTGLSMCITCTCFAAANKLTTAANAIVLQYTAPVFLLLYSALLFRRHFRRTDVLAVLFTMAGVALFFFDQLTPGRLLGNLVAVAAGASMGLMYLYMGDAEPAERFSSILLCEIFTVLIGLPFLFREPPELRFVPVLFIVLLGIFQLGIPYILYAHAAASCPPLACVLLSALEPLLNPVWVLLFYGERPGPFALLGGAVVVVTITLWCVLREREKTLGRDALPEENDG